jgi:hypothetical protein
MRSLSSRFLLVLALLTFAPFLFAHDVTITGTQNFSSLDGSASDHDGSVNGVFTVSDGNLTVNGTVNCNDDVSTNACAMAFAVSGNLTVNNGAALYAENRSGGGTGGNITLTVGGNLALNGTAIISSAAKSSSSSAGGAITATVNGNVSLASGSTIDSGSANAAGGAISLQAGGTYSIDGNILSGPSRTILATRLTGDALSGGSSNTAGGAITIGSSTFSEPTVVIGANANIISQGADGGAGPITINGCGIEIRGLVAALSKKASVAQVSIRSGKDVLIDGRDLGGSGTRMGRIRADAPTGTAINKGVDVFAGETVNIYGPSGTMYVITSTPGVHDSKSYGGLIRVVSLGDAVNASGNVIDDGHTASGDTGGKVEISAKADVNLATAAIRAFGDFNTGNSNRGGGSIKVRSYSGNVIWTNGLGDVRPVGSTSGLAPADQGSIVLTACGTINTTGTSFPVMGTATSPLPETHTGVCSPAAPSLPVGVPPLVTCNTPPVATDVSATTNEDNAVTITLSGSDADGDPLTFSIVTGPLHGNLGPIVPTGPTTATVNYTPNLNYNGPDSFVYQANDGNGGTDNATVTITVNPVNDPPSFQAGPTVIVLEDSGPQTYVNWATSISPGPADEAGQTVTFTVTNDNPSLFSVQPALASNGTLTFTPAANQYGNANITITAQDNGGTASGGNDTSAPQTSAINVTPVNDAPSFTAGGNVTVNEDSGAYSAAWATAISAGPNEGSQSVTFVVNNDNNALFASQPAISPTGVLSFTLAANANGSATVTVTLTDDGGTANGGVNTSAPQTFTITVGAVNDAPSFTSGGDVTVLEDSGAYSAPWATGISAGPADESGQTVSFNVSNDNNALFSAQPSISPTGVLTFTTATNAFGSATVTVTLSDNGGTAGGGVDTSAPQTFTITITAVNDEPSFTSGGNVTVNEDSGAYSAAWATAISAGPNESGQVLTFNVSNDNNALFSAQPSISSTGVLSFTPAANVSGTATVSVYLMDDGGTANSGDDTSATVTFTITVNPVNDAPSFTAGGDVTVNEDSGLYSAAWASAISAGPANESGQTLTFNVSNSNNALFSGQPTISASGVLSFTPAPNAFGSATVTVSLSDNGGVANGGVDTSGSVTFQINVNGVNDPPSAGTDSFTTFGNTELRVDLGAGTTPNVAATTGSGTGVLDNDADTVEGDSFAITGVVGCSDVTAPFDCTFGDGSILSLNANGTFSFVPGPGATSGSFQYVVTDMPSAGAPASATGTVNITVNEMIWYVNGSAPSGGNGTSIAPFDSFASLNGPLGVGDVDAPGAYIFVHTSNVTGSIGMEANQHLIGEGVGLTVNSYNLVPAGTRPNVVSSADTVTVSGVSGVEIAGLQLTSTAGNGIDVTSALAAPATGASIHDNVIAGAAQEGIDVNAGTAAGTTVNVLNTNIVSVGNGFDVVSLGPAIVSFNTGTITSTTGRGIRMVGSGNLTVSGLSNVTIDGNTAGDGINISDAAFDAVPGGAFNTVSGGAIAVGSSLNPVGGAGVILTNVSGDYAVGSLSAYAGVGAGVSVTGTGLFTGSTGMRITNGGGTIVAPAGAGLTVTSATIGAANLTFTSITSTGATNGINLTTTGSSGGLVVTGTGSAGSGGTILNTTGAGVRLSGTTSPSLSFMNITNSGVDGISGQNVNNFSLISSTVSDTAGVATDDGVEFDEVTGVVTITNSTITGSPHDNLDIVNTTGTSSYSITGSTFSNTSATTGNSGINFTASGSSIVTALNITGSTFSGNRADGLQISSESTSQIQATLIQSNQFTNNNIGVDLTQNGTSQHTLQVISNTFLGQASHAMNFFTGAATPLGGAFTAKVLTNTIGNAGVVKSGSAFGNGIRININGGADATMLVDGNVIRQTPFGRGIEVIGRNGNGGLDITVTNNNVDPQDTSGFPLSAIFVQSNCVSVCNTVRTDVRGNTVPAGATTDLLPTYLAMVRSSASTLQLIDTAPPSANCTAQLLSTNTGSASANAGCTLIPGPISTP